MPYRTRKQDT